MACDWTSLSDDAPLNVTDQIRISISFGCVPLSGITDGDIQNFLGQQQAVNSVLDVATGFLDSIGGVVSGTCNRVVTVNPQNGVSAGDLRNAMFTALNAADATHMIRAGTINVGLIQRQNSGLCDLTPGPVSTSTSFAVWGVALIAIVALIFFVNVKEVV